MKPGNEALYKSTIPEDMDPSVDNSFHNIALSTGTSNHQ